MDNQVALFTAMIGGFVGILAGYSAASLAAWALGLFEGAGISTAMPYIVGMSIGSAVGMVFGWAVIKTRVFDR